jgi:thioredoxin 1
MKPSSTSTGRQILPLNEHSLFEHLYNPANSKGHIVSPGDTVYAFEPQYPILINFTASWCGPCQRIDWGFLLEEFGHRFAAIYKCDIDQNKYTPGYCGVKAIPSWMILKGPKQAETVQISDTAKVASWIFNTLQKK